MIVVADAGPLLHLFWVDATEWALPSQPIIVVEEVWREVQRHEPRLLQDPRLRRTETAASPPTALDRFSLDAGERAALSYAYQHRTDDEILVLCDERSARQACRDLALPVTGSIGLIIEAARSGLVSVDIAGRALRELPARGRLHIAADLIERAIRSLS